MTVPTRQQALDAHLHAVARLMTEKQLQENVRQLALTTGWRFFHVLRPKGSPAGWPDCAMVRGPRFLVAELKTEKGRLTPDQQAWLDDLTAACVETYLWRPTDWLTGAVHDVLRQPR